MAPTRLVALALAATIFAASGCGGANNKSSVSLTRTDLIIRADAICRRVNTLHNSITITSQADEARVLQPLAVYERSALTSLDKLTPPTSMAGDWNEILANFRTLIDDTEKLAEAVKSNSLKQDQGLSETLNSTRKQINVIATHDGFQDCTRLGS